MIKKIMVLLVLFTAPAASGPAFGAEARGLTVRGGEPVTYRCSKSERIVAKYYSLSDDSLSFVKVMMPDGREYTLPNAVSASGARFTDDRTLVWWTKGKTAFVQERNQNGEWQTTHSDCSEPSEQ